MRLIFSGVIVLLLVVSSTLAQDDQTAIDVFVRQQMELRHIPGVSVGVIREGKVVVSRGYGMANVELGVPVTPDTVFEVMSVTKEFTAAAVMMLVEEGK